MAFTISAAIAGAGGVLYAHNLSTVTATPANFGYNMSIMILVFVVLGGMGSFRGSIIAAVILTFFAGGTAWTLRLSYADLFHRTDRNDAL